MLAALDFDEVMDAASDGDFKHNPSFQYPGTNYYTEVGKELLDQHNPDKAKQLLKEAGYKGEKVVLLTNKDYPSLYNTGLVVAQQMKAVGINAELLVLDWPTALQKAMKRHAGLELFLHRLDHLCRGRRRADAAADGGAECRLYAADEQDRSGVHEGVRAGGERRHAGGAPGRLRARAEDRAGRRDGDPDGCDAEGAGGARQRRALCAVLQSADVQCLGEELMRVIVIGAGVMGASVAYRAALGGASVTVLEAGRIGGGTSGSASPGPTPTRRRRAPTTT